MSTLEEQLYGHEVHGPVLGNLVFYEVRQARLPHAEGVAIYERHSMKEWALPLPPEPKDLDVFKRICSDNSRSETAPDSQEVVTRYMLRPVNPKLRRVVRERRNGRGETLAHDQIGNIRFIDGLVKVEPWEDDELAVTLMNNIATEYQEWRGCIHGYQLREWIRGTLLMHQATAIRSGLYFLTVAEAPTLQAMERFTKDVPGRIKFHTIPLVNTDDQVAMVEEAFTDEAVGAVDELSTEIAEILRLGNEITGQRAKGLRHRYAELTDKVDVYTKVLDKRVMTSSFRMEVLEQQLFDLGRLEKP